MRASDRKQGICKCWPKFLKFCPKTPASFGTSSTKQHLKHCEMAFSPSSFDEIIHLLSFMHVFIMIGQICSALSALKFAMQ